MKEELLKELKDAMLNKNELKKDTITMLRAAILQIEKDEQKNLTEDEMVAIVAREVKRRKEAIEEFKKGGREDLVSKTEQEIDILAKYLPKQLEKEEVESLVISTIQEVGATSPKDMGKVMQALKPKTAGRCDGKLLSDIVKEKLSNI